MEDLNNKAKKIISKILYITIATSSKNGKPWNSPVYSAFDENYNFYWNSWTKNQHSKNIKENPNVFIVIYDSTVPEGTGEGVYIKAKVQMLINKNEIEDAILLLQKRKSRPSSKLRSSEEFLGKYPRRVYKAIPIKIWMSTDGEVNGNYVDKRVEINLIK
jgi:uncharacterized protein YhbP (UPF0306 family)